MKKLCFVINDTSKKDLLSSINLQVGTDFSNDIELFVAENINTSVYTNLSDCVTVYNDCTVSSIIDKIDSEYVIFCNGADNLYSYASVYDLLKLLDGHQLYKMKLYGKSNYYSCKCIFKIDLLKQYDFGSVTLDAIPFDIFNTIVSTDTVSTNCIWYIINDNYYNTLYFNKGYLSVLNYFNLYNKNKGLVISSLDFITELYAIVTKFDKSNSLYYMFFTIITSFMIFGVRKFLNDAEVNKINNCENSNLQSFINTASKDFDNGGNLLCRLLSTYQNVSISSIVETNRDAKNNTEVYMYYMSNDNYVLSTLTSYISLLIQKPSHKIVCAVTEDVSQKVINILNKFYLETIPVKTIRIPDKFMSYYEGADLSKDHWYNAYGKIAIFGLDQYKKIVFIDGDTYICDDVESLFNYNTLSAVQADIPFGDTDFNSGVMVVEPSTRLLNDILRFTDTLDVNEINCEQKLLNKYYGDWQEFSEHCLPLVYNVNPFLFDDKKNCNGLSTSDTKIIHYIGKKPWEYKELFFNNNLNDDVEWQYRTYALCCTPFIYLYNKLTEIVAECNYLKIT